MDLLKQCEAKYYCNEQAVYPAMKELVEVVGMDVRTAAREIKKITKGGVTVDRARDVYRRHTGAHTPPATEPEEKEVETQAVTTEPDSVKSEAPPEPRPQPVVPEHTLVERAPKGKGPKVCTIDEVMGVTGLVKNMATESVEAKNAEALQLIDERCQEISDICQNETEPKPEKRKAAVGENQAQVDLWDQALRKIQKVLENLNKSADLPAPTSMIADITLTADALGQISTEALPPR